MNKSENNEYISSTNVPLGTIISSLLTEENMKRVNSGWVLCDGRELKGSQYDEYIKFFSKYTPKLNGRVLVGSGTADSGINYGITNIGGEETHYLSVEEMPKHSHTINDGDFGIHNNSFEGNHDGDKPFETRSTFPKNGTDATGGNDPHNNMQPYYVVYYYIYTGYTGN